MLLPDRTDLFQFFQSAQWFLHKLHLQTIDYLFAQKKLILESD